MEIRKATIKDLDKLTDLYRMLLKHHKENFGGYHVYNEGMVKSQVGVFKNIIESNESFVMVASEGDAILGMLVAIYAKGEPNHPYKKPVLVQDTVFLPEHRGKGVGHKILDKTIEICKKEGRDAIHMWVALENESLNRSLEEDYDFKNIFYFKSLKL